MAHIINLPVEFRFEVEPAIWYAAVAKPAGWTSGIISGPVLEIIEPERYCGVQSIVSAKHLPDQVSAYLTKYEHEPMIWRPGEKKRRSAPSKQIERDLGHHSIELLICDHPDRSVEDSLLPLGLRPVKLLTKAEKIDAWQLREEFLGVKQNTGDLVRFLNRWGTWSRETQYSRLNPISGEPGWEPRLVFCDTIWSDQNTFSRAFGSDRDLWLPSRSLGWFEVKDEFPHYVHRASTCREAIESTITFDFVRGLKIRLCALKDCGIWFKLESDHKRKFCSQYHAHLSSVRRNRKRAAESKRKSRAKGNSHGK